MDKPRALNITFTRAAAAIAGMQWSRPLSDTGLQAGYDLDLNGKITACKLSVRAMSRIEKTVFISYRRTNAPWALAVFQDLTQHGYDVFFDFQGIASGDFEQVILQNIRARAHFLVLLTPSALERCGDQGDWLRREIETALETRRNIVSLMLEGFDFATPSIASQLMGKLAALKRYNALNVPVDYFFAAMGRLREQFLNVSLEAVLHPASESARQAAETQQAAAGAAPEVGKAELTAQEWFERGFDAVDPDEEIRCYTEAIRLEPDFTDAYYNRGLAHRAKGDLDGAMADYTGAVRLKPDDAEAYNNRGNARRQKGDLDGAVADYAERSVSSPIMPRPTATGALRIAPRATSMAPWRITRRRSGSSPMMPSPTTTGAMRGAKRAT
jgi:tetratricopeptide (TPR) repeat protein